MLLQYFSRSLKRQDRAAAEDDTKEDLKYRKKKHQPTNRRCFHFSYTSLSSCTHTHTCVSDFLFSVACHAVNNRTIRVEASTPEPSTTILSLLEWQRRRWRCHQIFEYILILNNIGDKIYRCLKFIFCHPIHSCWVRFALEENILFNPLVGSRKVGPIWDRVWLYVALNVNNGNCNPQHQLSLLAHWLLQSIHQFIAGKKINLMPILRVWSRF